MPESIIAYSFPCGELLPKYGRMAAILSKVMKFSWCHVHARHTRQSTSSMPQDTFLPSLPTSQTGEASRRRGAADESPGSRERRVAEAHDAARRSPADTAAAATEAVRNPE